MKSHKQVKENSVMEFHRCNTCKAMVMIKYLNDDETCVECNKLRS